MQDENFNNSRSLDLHRTSSHSEVKACMAALLPSLYKRNPQKKNERDAAIQHLTTLSMDLYAVHCVDPDRWLGHSRDPKYYRAIPKRYNALNLSGERIVSLIDRLRKAGLVDYKVGFRATGNYKQGRWSRMRATPLLISKLQEFDVQPHMAQRCDDEEVIVLRAPSEKEGKSGKEIDYSDTPRTCAMRDSLRLINNRLREHHIDLDIPDDITFRLNEALRRRKDSVPFEPSRTRLRRIFNNGDHSFTQGGRFYGGFWQEIPNRDYGWRKHITIDGCSTTEIDYSGMHLRLVYAINGKTMPTEDPYSLDGYDAKVRDFMKVSVNTLLNASDERAAINAIRNAAKEWELPNDTKWVRALIGRFQDKHREIADYFYTGIGIRLQCIDSAIAEDILLTMGDRGILVLPIHDSFIVISKFTDMLREAMSDAWGKHVRSLPGLKIQRGEPYDRLGLDWNRPTDYVGYEKRKEQWARPAKQTTSCRRSRRISKSIETESTIKEAIVIRKGGCTLENLINP